MAEEFGILDPFRNKHSILQRLSADDVIVFLIATHNVVAAANLLLEIFAVLVGLKCNLGKSSVSPIFCEDDLIGEFRRLLNFQTALLSIKYLGLRKLHKENFVPC